MTLKQLIKKLGKHGVRKLSFDSGLSINTIYKHANRKTDPHPNNIIFYRKKGVTEFK